MHSLITYLRNVRAEFAHIVWPTSRTAVAHTLVVVLIAVIAAIFIGLLDALLRAGVSSIVGG